MKPAGLRRRPTCAAAHQAILGKTGAGRTATAKAIVEFLLDRGGGFA